MHNIVSDVEKYEISRSLIMFSLSLALSLSLIIIVLSL